MLVKLGDFGHLVYNQQNHIIFYWHFYAEWKTKISPKMFVYSQDDQSFYKCLNGYGGTFIKIYDDDTRLA